MFPFVLFGVFFPQENGRSEEKKQKEDNLFFFCLEPSGSMFMLNSLCSEICFTAMLSAFCLCGLNSERWFASVSHKAKDKLCYGKCQRKKHTETGREYKNTVSNCAGNCTAIAPVWLENSEVQWKTPNTH